MDGAHCRAWWKMRRRFSSELCTSTLPKPARVVEANLLDEPAQKPLPHEADAVARRAVPLAIRAAAGGDAEVLKQGEDVVGEALTDRAGLDVLAAEGAVAAEVAAQEGGDDGERSQEEDGRHALLAGPVDH